MQLSMSEIAAILGASSQVRERTAQGYSLDSRTLRPGELFFAIRGPRFDGHQFVAPALDKGAVGAVVENSFPQHQLVHSNPCLAGTLLSVPDTTAALKALALAVRRKWGRRLIAVTGSAGKTTTKELIATVLATRLRVHRSPGNLNNQYGVPLALLGLESQHEVAVIELAMSAPGEIASLARIAEPEIGVVTNVAPAHLEFFDSVDSIALAKRELIQNLKSPGTAVLNFDDVRVRRFAEGFTGHVISYGFEQGADFRAWATRSEPEEGSEFRVSGPGFAGDFHLRLPGRHNLQNALAAIATASLFGIRPADVNKALGVLPKLHLRNEILTLPSGITVINDSYNSNPLAMERMLETLATWPSAGRRIVVAGEMLELGSSSPRWHREIGRKCAQGGVEWLVAVQGDARFFVEGARQAGFPAERARFFSTPDEAATFCRKLLKPGDVALLKGSRAVHLEKVLELLASS